MMMWVLTVYCKYQHDIISNTTAVRCKHCCKNGYYIDLIPFMQYMKLKWYKFSSTQIPAIMNRLKHIWIMFPSLVDVQNYRAFI